MGQRSNWSCAFMILWFSQFRGYFDPLISAQKGLWLLDSILIWSQTLLHGTYKSLPLTSLVPRFLCVGREKRSCLHMLSSPRISGNLEIFCQICSVTLTSVRCVDFSRIKDAYHWPRSVWMMKRETHTSHFEVKNNVTVALLHSRQSVNFKREKLRQTRTYCSI